ncbi:hypothetical protein CHLRE_04g215450v5 [Chlamydomonas reinhardtii]|uniref:Uncharacterized protein n=1 Tax=Chlamydomonas reinhardtii TaxID=3055 RepID=A8J9R0_CHLRE|nr:uncharacterized protein CHLRE_04g215450v5 [Chlamydomonas reinhardtii]PNW83921.1 hypothetical protein CHLRE_04g215450v5 [Chlamydomonas reinhardtii]|eukprot:XP_001698661.1 predicted protein [Chlamydomonas reinhardtii]
MFSLSTTNISDVPLFWETVNLVYDSFTESFIVVTGACIQQLIPALHGEDDEPLVLAAVAGAILPVRVQANGRGNVAQFGKPTHIATDGKGTLYVLDQANIRKLQLPAAARYQPHQQRQRINSMQVEVTTLSQQLPPDMTASGMVYVPAGESPGGSECLILAGTKGIYRLPLCNNDAAIEAGGKAGMQGSGSGAVAGGTGGAAEATTATGSLHRLAGNSDTAGSWGIRFDAFGAQAKMLAISSGLALTGDGRVVFLDYSATQRDTAVRCIRMSDGRVSTLYEGLDGQWQWPCLLPSGCLAMTSGKDLFIIDLALPPPRPPPPPPSTGPPPRSLASDLGALLDGAAGAASSDLTILVGGRAFKAHRVILAARCEYFAKRLEEGAYADGAKQELELPEAEPAAFEVLLRWLYTGAADVPAELAQEVAVLADRLVLPELCDAAQAVVLESVTPGSVAAALVWAASCVPGRGSSFEQVLRRLKKWYVAHYDKVRSEARASVVALMASNPELAMELQEEVLGATERRVSKKQRV